MKIVFFVGIVLVMVVGGCGSDGGGNDVVTLEWEECHGEFECATMTAPLDYNSPKGDQIEITVLRARARVRHERVGVLLWNPGGPGGGVIEHTPVFFEAFRMMASVITDRFDFISMDPRGVDLSAPVDCVDDAQIDAIREMDFTPPDDPGFAVLDTECKKFCDGCLERSGADLLKNVYSENTARDMDRLRRGLGEEKINYLGISYGTRLGYTYVTMFPERVRAVVLDSIVAPYAGVDEIFVAGAGKFEAALDRFFADCGGGASCSFHGGEGPAAVTAAFDAVKAQVEAAPIPAGDGNTLGKMNFNFALWFALRGGFWDALADGLAAAEAGDGSKLLSMADNLFTRREDGTYPSFLESFFAIQYIDTPCPADFDLDAYKAKTVELAAVSPRTAATNAALISNCIHWPVTREIPVFTLGATSAPPLLLLNSRYDPITPHENAVRVVDLLDNGSHLVTWEGEGHGTSSHDTCSFQIAVDFMLDPDTPPEKTVCP